MWNFGANGTRKNTHKQTWTPNYMQCWCGTRPSSMLEWLWSNWIQSSGLNFCANWGAKYEVNIEFLLALDYTVLSIALLLFFFLSHTHVRRNHHSAQCCNSRQWHAKRISFELLISGWAINQCEIDDSPSVEILWHQIWSMVIWMIQWSAV